jgi:hypothetical protein
MSIIVAVIMAGNGTRDIFNIKKRLEDTIGERVVNDNGVQQAIAFILSTLTPSEHDKPQIT